MLPAHWMDDKILEQGPLTIAVADVQMMDHEQYALVRKDYFGASDSSILCGVNLYKTMDELIKEKNCKYITDEEKAVGEKAIVRKGYDLEIITLNKAEMELGEAIYKPDHMYKFKHVDGLSVNFDGVLHDTTNQNLIPVEAKLVSKYGEKYYNKNVTKQDAKTLDMKIEGTDLESHIKRKATKLGIPAYYYTQVQQQIAGLNAPYGYLAAMFDETWTFKLFYIPRDNYVIESIYKLCEAHIGKIKRDTN